MSVVGKPAEVNQRDFIGLSLDLMFSPKKLRAFREYAEDELADSLVTE